MKFVWATQSRSGSQFLLKLTLDQVGSAAWPQARISGTRREGLEPDRQPGFTSLLRAGRGLDYFEIHNIQAVKLEDPGNDDLAEQLANRWPTARYLTSLRPIEAILISHHNIRKWGHDEDYVLSSYRASLPLFERLAGEGRLMTVRVDRPEAFDPERFARFLGSEQPRRKLLETVAAWEPTNTLAYQKGKWGERFEGQAEVPEGLATLRDRHPWLVEVEERYDRLWSMAS